MKTKNQVKKLDEFQMDSLKRPECIIGGVGETEIDKDKAGTIPGQGN